ncbi:MAG: hypothetical protein RSD81_00950 [Pseudomonas sp.]
MALWKIDSRVRQAAYLTRIGHESGHPRNLVKNMNYSAEGLMRICPTRFNAARAKVCARQPVQHGTEQNTHEAAVHPPPSTA